MKTFIVDKTQRLDQFLSLKMPNFSRSYIQKLIKSGNVFGPQDCKNLQSSNIVQIGQRYKIIFPIIESKIIFSQKLKIVYQDDDLLVINKDPGITVHPGIGTNGDTLVDVLRNAFGESNLSSIDPNRPGIVHRLDKHTSGLMLVAKNNQAHYILANAIANKEIKRTYIGLVWGVPDPNSGSINAKIGRGRGNSKVMQVRTNGKYAITHYSMIKKFGSCSLVQFILDTGRTHQIRVHSLHAGFPIVGDKTYTMSKYENTYLMDRQALHSFSLLLNLPFSNKPIKLKSKLPNDMLKAISILS